MTRLPLAVDMDGTLLTCDVLYTGMAKLARTQPWALADAYGRLVFGRPAFKAAIAERAKLAIDRLPVRDDFLAYLHREKAAGRMLALATAADSDTARKVAARFALFDLILTSHGRVNLKGPRKAEALAARFPEGFVYAGDSLADLAVWRVAKAAIVCGTRHDVRAALDRLASPIEASFE